MRATVLAGAGAALLVFPGMASAAVTSTVAAGTLTVTATADDAITITCDPGGALKVNGADPAPATNCAAITAIDVNGGPLANVISLTGVTDAAFGDLPPITIDAGAGDDSISGSELVDVIHGDEGNDRIIGDDNPATTRDEFYGDAGDDTLVWNGGEDDDRMEGGDGNDTIEVNGAAAFGETFTVKPSATAGRILFDRTGPSPAPGVFNLDIGTAERLDLNMSGGDDSLVTDGGIATSFILDVDGGAGNDSIDGGDSADLLLGGDGNDRIIGDDNPLNTRDNAQGQGGDDTMVWNPGDDDDINEGGAGNDVAEINGGDVAEEFEVKPSATAGRVSFDRTGPTPPGAFNVDIGTTEDLKLNAAGGNDRIRGAKGLAGLIRSTFNGDDGNDRITGTDGADALSGGKGLDRINAVDRAADAVECNGGLDFALVDRRDTVRACELVLGGRLKVKLLGSPRVEGNTAVLRLKCVVTSRCKGRAVLRRNGKGLGSARFDLKRNKAKTVRVSLNSRGRRVVANAPAKGARVTLRIDSRDKQGNGWRTKAPIRLKR